MIKPCLQTIVSLDQDPSNNRPGAPHFLMAGAVVFNLLFCHEPRNGQNDVQTIVKFNFKPKSEFPCPNKLPFPKKRDVD